MENGDSGQGPLESNLAGTSVSRGLVKLNVGGTWFHTTRTTLLKFPDGTLAAMLERGKACHRADGDEHGDGGFYFIDRDSSLFHFVLNYMRTCELYIPESFSAWSELIAEAKFYNLPPLEQEIRNVKQSRREHSVVEIIELAHPEKVGLCCTRLIVNDRLLEMPPFCDVIDMGGKQLEMNMGPRGRCWVRSGMTRDDWSEMLQEYGWKMAGMTSFCRKINDITGGETDICHIIEKWSHCGGKCKFV